MHPAFDVGLRMVHDFMDVAPVQLIVGHGIISEHKRTVLNIFQDFILQCLALHVRHYRGANLALVAIKHSHDNGFAGCTASVSALSREALTAITVHVAELAADESFIYLNPAALGSAELGSHGVSFQYKSQPMQHEPCAFLRDAESAMKLVRGNAILATN